jgi:DNA repair exonuclease SbcCD ATPase subunit
MATVTGKIQCVICKKEKSAVRCEGCLQIFCRIHLNDHSQQLSQQLDDIEINRDLFRQTLNEQINHPQKHVLIKQIDKWESDSIEIIQKTAKECREKLLQHTNQHFNQMEMNLTKLTNKMREIRQENDFNEIDLNNLKQKLTELEKQLDQIPNVYIQEDSTTFVKKLSVIISSSKYVFIICKLLIRINGWKKYYQHIMSIQSLGNMLRRPRGI